MNRKQHRPEKQRDRVVLQGASPAVQRLFAAASQHHQAGRFSDAELFYRNVLAADSRHADSLHLLGVIGAQTGRHDLAAEMIGRAIAINPKESSYHSNLGTALREQGRLDEAVACYRRAIDLRPNFPMAYYNLGNTLWAQRRLDEAVACLRRAIDLKPDFAEAQNNLGTALQEQGRLDEAIACYRRTIDLRPGIPEAHNNLGNAYREQGSLDEAVGCYRRALNLKPDFPEAHNNLGTTLKELGRLDEAIVCCRRAIDLSPDYAEAHYNLGNAYREQGSLDEAGACYRRAIELDPESPGTHNNLAMALLAQGDMPAGWEEYEWRWKTSQMIKSRRAFAQPQWRGEPAEGRALLIHAEQGYGDTLQFCRYAPLAASRGARVILEVPKPLVRLLRGLPGVDQVVGHGEGLPQFALHCPMLSMPLALGTTITTIPDTVPYLHADRAQVAAWRTRLAAMANQGPRIGLVWAGNSRKDQPAAAATDRRRSIAPDRLQPLFALPGPHFFSLQKAGPAAPEHFPLTDFMDEMEDFADTAALIANLDLVISVDTAVAHLAAALGKPVWLLDRFDPCWRWLTGRRDSPWYPTLRIYRQPHPGDWNAVLAEVARDLHSLARA